MEVKNQWKGWLYLAPALILLAVFTFYPFFKTIMISFMETLKMYLKQGLIKVEIAYCQGKTHADQRETLKKRETERELQRFVRK